MNALTIMSVSLLALEFASATRATPGTLVINEVLANPWDEDTGEFVELFNWGDGPVDVVGWKLADSADTNDLIEDYMGPHDWGLRGTTIPPGGYALIVDPEYAGEYTPFLEANADTNSVVLLTIGKDTTIGNGLTNAADIVLISDGALFLAMFNWSSDPGQGISWEKIEPDQGDGEANWAPCQHSHGSTPGARNSLSRALYDVRIPPGGMQLCPASPPPGQLVEIRARIHNQGKNPATGVRVCFFLDVDADSLLGEGEQIGSPHLISETIPPDQSVELGESWLPATSGAHAVAVEAFFAPDEDLSDNVAVTTLQVRYAPWTMVINEILYDPAPIEEESEKEPEWVEILHLGEQPIDLMDWTIEDSRGQPRVLCDSTVLLAPGDYAVLAAGDAEQFETIYGRISCPLLFPIGGLPSLNNSEDLLVLRDPPGSMVDSVFYRQQWGGGGGISLERINSYLGSNDPLNWSWCVHPRGCTPGKRNSIFTPIVPGRSSLFVAPNPFSPDGDGYHEVTMISYRLPTAAARIRLEIYDIRGRRVRTLKEGERCTSQGDVLWDGRNDSGELLKLGIYIIYLEALDDQRGLACRCKGTVVLARKLD